MNNLIKKPIHFYRSWYVLPFLLAYACSSSSKENLFVREGYRYVMQEDIATDPYGKLVREAKWMPVHYIASLQADSLHIYGNYDSIWVKYPPDSVKNGNMFRKVDIRAESWKAKPNFDKLRFVGNFTTEKLPGLYASYYFTPNRNAFLQILYTNPGHIVHAALVARDSVNFLKEKNILLVPGTVN